MRLHHYLLPLVFLSFFAQAQESAADYTKQAKALEKSKKTAQAKMFSDVAAMLTPTKPGSFYDLAAEAWRQEIDSISGGNQTLLAIAYENLGLVLEANKNTQEAIDAYANSLAAKTNKTVLKRLSALDPYAPVPMKGPYSSLKDWCKEISTGRSPAPECDTDPTDLTREFGLATAKASGPYKEIQLVAVFGDFEAELYLAVKRKAGWFVSADYFPKWRTAEDYFETYHHQLMIYDTENKLTVKTFEVSDLLPGGDPEISLSFSHNYGIKEGPGVAFYDTAVEATILCGVGTSGEPSVTRAMVTKVSGGTSKSKKDSLSYSVSITKTGELAVKQTKKSGKPLQFPETQASLGTRPLIFP
jgi:hypothetical protein